MKLKSVLIRLVMLILCIMTLGACMQASAIEKSLNIDFVKITGDGFVADTFNGVEARYNLYGRTIYCNELIERYYETVYGVTVRCTNSGPEVVGSDTYRFRKTTNPRPGDIMFGSARARRTGYNHWAICRSMDASTGVVTLFEQNWRWNGSAGTNRTILMAEGCYAAYELVTDLGRVIPNL